MLEQRRIVTGGASQVAFSRDGTRLLVAKLFGGVIVYHTRTWKQQFDIQTNGKVTSLRFSEAGDFFATGLEHGEIQLWNTRGDLVQSIQASDTAVSALAFAADDSRLICSSAHHVRICRVSDGAITCSFERRLGDIWHLVDRPDGAVEILAGRRNASLQRYTLSGRGLAPVWRCPVRGLTCVHVSPDLQRVAAGTESGQVLLLDFLRGTVLRTLECHQGAVSSLAFSSDGILVATGGFDRAVKVWCVCDQLRSRTLEEHEDVVMDLAFSPDGTLLVSATQAGVIRGWGMAFCDCLIRSWTGHAEAVNDLTFSPDGRLLVSSSDDFSARIWDWTTGVLSQSLEGHQDSVTAVAWAPDGSRVATGSRDAFVRLWRIRDAEPLETISSLPAPIRCLAFSPNGSILAVGLDNGHVQLLRIPDLQRVCTISGLSKWVDSLAFSPDGVLLACGSYDGSIRVFSTEQWIPVQTLRSESGLAGGVNRIVFSLSGDVLICGSASGSIRVFRVSDGREIFRLEGHEAPVTGLAISPDGQTLVSSSWDHSVRTWRLPDGIETDRFPIGLKQRVNAIACSPVGPIIACGTWDGTLSLVHIPDKPPLDEPVASQKSGETEPVHSLHSPPVSSPVTADSERTTNQMNRLRELGSSLRDASTRAQILGVLETALQDGEDLSSFHRMLAELLNRADTGTWARRIVEFFRRCVECRVDISRAVQDLFAAMRAISYHEEPADLVDASDLAAADPTTDIAAILSQHFLNQQDIPSLEFLLNDSDPSVSQICRKLIRKALHRSPGVPNPLLELLRRHPDRFEESVPQ